MARQVDRNMPGRSGRYQSGGCRPYGVDKRVAARANSGGKQTGLGHRNRVVPLSTGSVLYTCIRVDWTMSVIVDHVTRLYNMDVFRNHTPHMVISISVSSFLNHSKSSLYSRSWSMVGICLFFLCRGAQKLCGHQPQSHNLVNLPTSIMHRVVCCYVITEDVNIYFQCVWDRYGRRKSHLKASDTILKLLEQYNRQEHVISAGTTQFKRVL